MKIVIFGSKKCKYCEKQISFVKSSFSENDWMYIDVAKDKNMFKIASDSNVENIPTTIVFNDNWDPVFRQEGTISADNLFFEIYGNKNIPLGPKTSSLLKEKKITSCILSKKIDIKVGENVDLVDYNNKKILNAKILSLSKISPKVAEKLCNPVVFKEYLEQGGRKDWTQLVVFGI